MGANESARQAGLNDFTLNHKLKMDRAAVLILDAGDRNCHFKLSLC